MNTHVMLLSRSKEKHELIPAVSSAERNLQVSSVAWKSGGVLKVPENISLVNRLLAIL